jgi:hypothetical protein
MGPEGRFGFRGGAQSGQYLDSRAHRAGHGRSEKDDRRHLTPVLPGTFSLQIALHKRRYFDAASSHVLALR